MAMPPSSGNEALLSLQQAAVCLHFVDSAGVSDADPYRGHPDYPEYPPDSVLGSMERDLLSYSFQRRPPFQTTCQSQQIIALLLPEVIEYESEGTKTWLRCPQTRRLVGAMVSRTLFFESRIVVWHVVLTPVPGECFSERDIITLLHLYGEHSETVRFLPSMRFEVGGRGWVEIEGLLAALDCGKTFDLRPTAGTVEIVTGDEPDADLHQRVLDTVIRAGSDDGARRQLALWLQQDRDEGRLIKVYCGLISRIFDFDRIGLGEVLDTLELTHAGHDSLLRVHRGTVTRIERQRRLSDEIAVKVGINPYRIIPHAVLLHNEEVLRLADEKISKIMSTDPRLSSLEDQRARIDHLLHRLLPNVFQYATERAFYERGWHGRGNEDRRSAVVAQFAELNALLRARWEWRSAGAQRVIQALLAVLAFAQVWSGWRTDYATPVSVALSIAAVLLIVLVIWRYGRGREPWSRASHQKRWWRPRRATQRDPTADPSGTIQQ